MAIYVRMVAVDLEKYRREYLTYIRGQNIVGCKHHDVPLITAPPSSRSSGMICGHAVDATSDSPNGQCKKCQHLQCPVEGCCIAICKKCFAMMPSDRMTLCEVFQPHKSSGQCNVSGYDSNAELKDSSSEENSLQQGSIGASDGDSLLRPRSPGDDCYESSLSSQISGDFSVDFIQEGSNEENSSDGNDTIREDIDFDMENLQTGFDFIRSRTGEGNPDDKVEDSMDPIILMTHAGGVVVPVMGKVNGVGTSVFLNKCPVCL